MPADLIPEPPNGSVVLVTFPDTFQVAVQRFGDIWCRAGSGERWSWADVTAIGPVTLLGPTEPASGLELPAEPPTLVEGDLYTRCADALWARSRAEGKTAPDVIDKGVRLYAADRDFRAAVDEAVRVGRETAAQAILDHADRHAPRDRPTADRMRSYLRTAAQVATSPATPEQVAAALAALAQPLVPVVCHLDDAGRPAAPGAAS